MEKKILSLSAEGKIVVKSPDGKQYPVSSGFSVSRSDRAVVYLLVDCSGSMSGEKIAQAKQGSLDFARTAVKKGYLVGLIRFDDSACLICEPTPRFSLIAERIEEFIAGGNTNLTAGLRIAFQKLIGKRGCRVVLVATDGYPGEPFSALETAAAMKKDRIEILAISTEDANQDFLSRLVSRKDLNLRVERNEFQKGMNLMAEKLPRPALEDKR